jgi:cellulose synthase/poly-beta-1,6-N-acetylglucosamine synthase-like glycosyltransferase
MDSDFKNLPSVSIIIPCYNAENSIGECLESVINLFYPKDKLEIIVVDNNSTDRSRDIIRSFPVIMLEEKEIQTSYAARNKGISAAKGEWLAFTDADCVADRNWLYYLMLNHHNNEEVGCIAGQILPYKPRTLTELYSARKGILDQKRLLTELKGVATANVAYRKSVFEKIGPFNANTISGGDIEMSWRMQDKLGLKIAFVEDAVIFHKHRKTIYGLYRQYYRYGIAHIFLWRIFPDNYQLYDAETRFKNTLKKAIQIFPSQLIKFIKGEIDEVELCAPFLDCVIALAIYRARKKYAPELLHGTRMLRDSARNG